MYRKQHKPIKVIRKYSILKIKGRDAPSASHAGVEDQTYYYAIMQSLLDVTLRLCNRVTLSYYHNQI